MLTVLSSLIRLVYFAVASLFYGIPQSLTAIYLVGKFGNQRDRQTILHRAGARVSDYLHALGPTFIKLGQALSTRPDILGDHFTNQLALLQDRLPPFSNKEVAKALKDQFGLTHQEIFAEFEITPKAAASIAQVHKARLKTGEVVAVKILRPKIEKRIARDIALLRFCAKIIQRLHSGAKTLRPIEVVEQLQQSMSKELDLRLEAASADQIRHNIANDPWIIIPAVHWNLTTQRVMVTQWIEGTPVNDQQAIAAKNLDLHEVAKRLAITFFNQAYRDGFFHADLHPGNILVTAEGKVALIDFGIIGVLSHEERVFLARMLYGFIKRDYLEVSRLHQEIGYLPPHKDIQLFALACRSIGEPIIGQPVNRISAGNLLKQLFTIAKDFDMVVQPQLILLQKTMITLEGVGYSIYPEVNMWQLAEPWIEKWARENFGLKANLKNLRGTTARFLQELPHTMARLNNIIIKLEEQPLNYRPAAPTALKSRNKLLQLSSGVAIGLVLGYIIMHFAG